MTAPDTKLVAILDDIIPRYVRTLRDAISDAEGEDRLTMQQLRCLQAIAAESETGATTTRLADAMRVTVPTMSSMLDGLSNRGLIERRVDPQSRRRIPLFLTAEGLRLIERYQHIMDARHREIVSGLLKSEQESLLRSMSLLAERLTAVEERGAREPSGAATNR